MVNEIRLFVVDDDAGHARLIEKNLVRSGYCQPSNIRLFSSGFHILDFLLGDASRLNFHSVIILDLNMPGMNGIQVLTALKQDSRTRNIPVVIFTTADDTVSKDECYSLGCALCLKKPVEYDDFVSTINHLGGLISVLDRNNDH